MVDKNHTFNPQEAKRNLYPKNDDLKNRIGNKKIVNCLYRTHEILVSMTVTIWKALRSANKPYTTFLKQYLQTRQHERTWYFFFISVVAFRKMLTRGVLTMDMIQSVFGKCITHAVLAGALSFFRKHQPGRIMNFDSKNTRWKWMEEWRNLSITHDLMHVADKWFWENIVCWQILFVQCCIDIIEYIGCKL